MEPTSIESYYKAVESGFISEKQRQVITYFCDSRGESVTQGEVNRYFKDTNRSYAPRFKELENAGVIQCVGTKYDHLTGRNVKSYKLTGKIPTAPVKRRPSAVSDKQRKEWAERAAKHHNAYNVPQVVELIESFGKVRSEVAAFELVRLIKMDRINYGGCFRAQII
jgi:hypothetical protein